MRGVVNGCNRSGGGICGSRMMSSVAEKKEIGNGVEAKKEEKEKAVVSSYWGISRTNIKRQDGTEWPWNCFMVTPPAFPTYYQLL
jgi:ubiquinol oxidase